MRILFIDIDTLRPDHLGCYGYHRNTSPNLDWIASQGRRFDNCYVSDAPCLPSRAALWSGRTGFHNGAINHGGVAADPFHEGPGRMFRDRMDATGWIPQLRKAGLYPVTVSPFGERHSSWWWYAGWREAYNPGKGGMELADDVTPLALDWITKNAQKDNWFLHVNYWDPHTPYRTPQEYGSPFANDPLPDWLNEPRAHPKEWKCASAAGRALGRIRRANRSTIWTALRIWRATRACRCRSTRWRRCANGSTAMTPGSGTPTGTWGCCWTRCASRVYWTTW